MTGDGALVASYLAACSLALITWTQARVQAWRAGRRYT